MLDAAYQKTSSTSGFVALPVPADYSSACPALQIEEIAADIDSFVCTEGPRTCFAFCLHSIFNRIVETKDWCNQKGSSKQCREGDIDLLHLERKCSRFGFSL